MPRPSAWNSPTTAIRLPKHAVEACLELARTLDQPISEGFVQNTDPLLITVGQGTECDRYLLPSQALTPEQANQMDTLIDQVLATVPGLGKDAEALLLAELTPRVLSPI